MNTPNNCSLSTNLDPDMKPQIKEISAVLMLLTCLMLQGACMAKDFDGVKPIKTYKKILSCLKFDCELTNAQVSALGSALSMYKKEMNGKEGGVYDLGINDKQEIVVTVFPNGIDESYPSYSAANKTITYIFTSSGFNSSGLKLERKIYNR